MFTQPIRLTITALTVCFFVSIGKADEQKRLNPRLAPGKDFVASLEFKSAVLVEEDDPTRLTFHLNGAAQSSSVRRSMCVVFEEASVSHLPLKPLVHPTLNESDLVRVASQNKILYVLLPKPAEPATAETELPNQMASPAGVTTEPLNAAIDIQLEINKLATTGGTLHLPNGVYNINKPITVPSNVSIEGDGSNTLIVNKSSNYAIKIVGVNTLATRIIQDISQAGGVGTSHPAIRVENATGFVVGGSVKIVKDNAFPLKTEFNKVFSIAGNVITFQDNFIENYRVADAVKVVAVTPVKNVAISNLAIMCDAGTAGFGIFASNTETLQLTNLRLNNIARKSIHVESSYLPRIENNTLMNNGCPGKGDYGIGSVMNMGATVTGNKLASSGAIVVKGNLHAIVKNNHSDSTGLTGGDGISVISTIGSTFEGNTISRSKCYGIWMHHSSERNSVSNNQFASGITSAIYVTNDCVENIISDNMLTNNNGNGVGLDDTADRNIVKGNISRGNKGRGIIVEGHGNSVVGNTLRLNGLEPLFIREGRGNLVRDNLVQ